MSEERERLYDLALAADKAYTDELYRLYGKRYAEVRYGRKGSGEPGTELRRLFEAKVSADADWHEFMRVAREARRLRAFAR